MHVLTQLTLPSPSICRTLRILWRIDALSITGPTTIDSNCFNYVGLRSSVDVGPGDVVVDMQSAMPLTGELRPSTD
jgi:hypothetical protein